MKTRTLAKAISLATASAALCLAAPASAIVPPEAGALTASTLKLPDGPASIRGLADDASLDVFTGQVAYAVPIDAPEGPGGFRPKLELTYSGALGNGPLGVGWSLGIAAIRRSDRRGVPSFTDADELVVSGVGVSGRLIAVPDGTLRVEGAGQHARVVRETSGGFELTTADGVTYRLGTSPETRQESGARVSAWYVESVVDRAGQRVDFTYLTERGQVYPRAVSWGPRGAFRVEYELEDRPDAVTGYRAGFEVTTARRVRAVVVKAWGEVLRSYELAYDDGLPLSRLRGVRVTGRGGASGYPALSFDYGEAKPASTVRVDGLGGWQLNARGVAIADVDGDGRPDLLRAESTGHSFRRNLGGCAFDEPASVPGGRSLDLKTARLLDVDGDMRPELVTVIGGTWRVRRLVNGEWSAPVVLPGTSNVPMSGAGLALGRVVFDGDPFEAPAAPETRPSAMTGQRYVFDALGRTTEHHLPNGAVKRSRHAAFEVTTSAPELAPVTTYLDGLGRVTRTHRLVAGSLESVDAEYDAAGQIVRLQLQGGAVEHRFTYDTLGRLVAATDPDNGDRSLSYDDHDALVEHVNGAGETIRYEYDDVGRVTRTTAAAGGAFVYHYDDPKHGDAATARTLGRVAWIEEPTGEVHYAYDEDGQVAVLRRSVEGRSVEERRTHAPGGALLGLAFDDGFAYELAYDDAGRVARAGSYWEALTLDARGAVVSERYGNGMTQHRERDAMGQATRVRIERPSRASVYDVDVERNAFGAIVAAHDCDGVGIDHAGTFTYDGAGRLTGATLGTGAQGYRFAYSYDGLQNVTSRSASGPRELGVLAGTYVYGENGGSPRQVSRVRGGAGDVTFAYDAAGRTIRQGDRTMSYDAFDQLVEVVRNAPTPTLTRSKHAYGHDGARVWTRNEDGTEDVWLSDGVSERNGMREHTVVVEGQTVAKVSTPIAQLSTPASGPLAAGRAAPRRGSAGWALLSLVAAALALIVARAPVRRRAARLAPAFASMALVALAACSPGDAAHERRAQTSSASTSSTCVYFHQGFTAGPSMFSAEDGSVLEERRFEPFGQPIDAYSDATGAGLVDFAREPRNALDKDTDPSSGWSYHGARWMAPALARWLTPDAPTKGPDPRFLVSPWDLNPYQYVRSNPLVFWDPDGNDLMSFGKGLAVGIVKAAVVGAAVAAVAAVAPVAATAIGVGMAAASAYSFYQNRHEVVAMAQRFGSGTSTNADHQAVGEMVGGAIGGRVGGAVGVRVGGAIKGPSASVLKPPPSLTPKSPKGGPSRPAAAPKPGQVQCFAAGTLVMTEDGDQPIETIAVGDKVWGVDEVSGTATLETVTHTYETPAMDTMDIAWTTEHGSSEHVRVTPSHPFWVEGRGWVRADQLHEADSLVDVNGSAVHVVAVTGTIARETVFNLTVAHAHTYFVGHGAVLTHNEDAHPNARPTTAPRMPAAILADQDGVVIRHNYHGIDHGPAHLHVVGGGQETRIGMNGKPLRNNPPLTSTQADVVKDNKKLIRKTVDTLQRYHRFNTNQQRGGGNCG